MLIYTAKLPRRKIFFALAVSAAALLVGALFALLGGGSELPAGATDEERVAYLRSLGWEAEPAPVETVRLALPDPLTEPYLSYNALQTAQGFDLAPYAGKALLRCTYALAAPDGCSADLFVYRGRIVAGSVTRAGEDGGVVPLRGEKGETPR